MGLYISHLDTVTIKGERSLYLYLLDYGWSDGKWEKLFKTHFMTIAGMATETNSVVIASPSGKHFGNEVLSYYNVGHLDADKVLPGLLITKTHPEYFQNEKSLPVDRAVPGMEDLLVIPVEPFCTSETDFLRAIESVFADLENGAELQNFSISEYDLRQRDNIKIGSRAISALELKPNFFGLGVDLRKIFSGD